MRPLLDEGVALRAASLVAAQRRTDPAEVVALRAEMAADLPAIDAAARAWTRLGADLPATSCRVVGRTEWVRINLATFQDMLAPVRERLDRRGPLARRAMSAQLGGLLGLLSSKVLGQYVLPLGNAGSGQLLVVGPNVLQLADEQGPLARDIRRAVLLHEVTHRLQFDGVPWLGDHLRGLVGRYLHGARLEGIPLAEIARDLPDALAAARDAGDVRPLLEVVLTPEQAEIVDQAQGLMSLLEGHGNATMLDAASPGLVTDPDAVRDALASRHGDLTAKVLTAVAGLEMKRRQYREGEAFVRDVLDLGGIDALNLAFRGPGDLPSADEVRDPAGWLARVRAA